MSIDYDFDRQERKDKFKKFLGQAIFWIIGVGICFGLAWAINHYAFEKTNLTDASMEPTLLMDQTILINKMAYFRSDPERFDIIVYQKDGKEHSYYSVKRVIGLPGDHIQISGGRVYINGELLEERAIVEDMLLAGVAEEEMILDDDEYFVLGDNRNDSEDSRFTYVGNVVREEIIGSAFLRLNKFGIISKLNLAENAGKLSAE